MCKQTKPVAFAAILAALALPAHGANLVQNGDFDENAEGWSVIGHECANWYCLDEGCGDSQKGGWDGECGWFYLNDAADEVPETNQVIKNLTPGQKYVVSGYFVRDTDNYKEALFRVLIDDKTLFEAGGEGVWTKFEFTYIAEDSDALLRFQSQINGDDAHGIDHISMVAAEPCYADCNGDGVLDLFDFLCFVNAFNAGC